MATGQFSTPYGSKGIQWSAGRDYTDFRGQGIDDWRNRALRTGYTPEMFEFAMQDWESKPDGYRAGMASQDNNILNWFTNQRPDVWARKMQDAGVPIGTSESFEELRAKAPDRFEFMEGTYTPPTSGGGGLPSDGGGGSPVGTPAGGGSPMPPGYGQPAPEYDWGESVQGGGIAPPAVGWGEFDEPYGGYDRYQPGQDSPWGNPEREGGNQGFYQQQFANLLRQSQNADILGERARLKRAQNPGGQVEDPNFSWDWMGGAPEAPLTGGEERWGGLDSAVTGDMTNRQALDAVRDQIDPGTYDFYQNVWEQFPGGGDSSNWGSFDNVDQWRGSFNDNIGPQHQSAQDDLGKALWEYQSATNNVPPGYASPVPGMVNGFNQAAAPISPYAQYGGMFGVGGGF